MGAEEKINFVSVEDYLEGEKSSELKHEYVDGQVYAMSGGTANHSAVSVNFQSGLREQLRDSSCRAFNSDFNVRIQNIGGAFFYYPDSSVIRNPVDGSDLFSEAPVVILEVFSPSTRKFDDTQKKKDYFTIPSLKVLILAEPDTPFCNIYRRNGNQFTVEIISGIDEVLDLPEIQCSLPLADLYRDVDLDETETSKSSGAIE